MLLLRVIGLLAVCVVGGALVLYIISGQRRYLGLAWRVTKVSLLLCLGLFALLAFERLLVAI